MKIIITEEQYKKVLLKEFGETISSPKEWYDRILDWVDDIKDLRFDNLSDEVVAYDNKGVYLGYYDKDQEFGFVVTEYGIGLDDEYDDEESIDEQESEGTSSGGSSTKWEDVVSLTRGPANTLDNSPWSVTPTRGPSNQLT
jgi:hypothetical protein|tara:strand:- start:33 stop:455 length:423 start_codon:yes stop_codon:yes gene_type:complete